MTRLSVFPAVLLLLAAASASGAVQYAITDLGTLGGTYSYATGINSSGQVVGYSYITGNAASHAFLYSGSTMTDLGTLGGTWSGAYGINSSGQVVGSADTTGNAARHAFLYSGSTMTDLGTLGGTSSGASGINSSGQVVGGSYYTNTYPRDFDSHAFLYSGSTMTDLGTLGGASSGAGRINSSGQVAGSSTAKPRPAAGSDDIHAFLYSGSMTDLGTLGGRQSDAGDINDSGQVVGWSETSGSGNGHAYLYSGSTMTDLGTLGGTSSGASGINNSGQVVGWSSTSGAPEGHAFRYSGSTMTDLNSLIAPSSGWTLSAASAINDKGQIAGSGNHNGAQHAFLLNPMQIVELAWNQDVPVHITEVVDRFGHRSYPVDATQTMPAPTTTSEFRQEVVQRVQQMYTDSGVQNVLVTDTHSPGAAMVYFTDPTAGGLDGMAYTGVDQFNKDRGGAAAVFLKKAGQADYGEYNAETVTHEVGHLLGLRHVNPGSTADPNDLEVMDYDNNPSDRERSINTISTTFDGDGVTHNPVYHLRRYIDMLSDGTLVGQGINPGTWDITTGTQGQTTKIEFDASEKTLFDAYLFGGLGDADSLLTLGHFDAVTLSELSELEFLLPEGSALRLVAASTLGGELDITLATGNPYDADSVFIDATIGQVFAYLQEWSDTGPGYLTLSNATVTSTLVAEPSTLVLLCVGAISLLAYAWRRRKWAV